SSFPPNIVPYAFVSGGKTCAIFTANECEHGLASCFIRHSSILFTMYFLYNTGDKRRDIDSLNRILSERCCCSFFVICVDCLISALKGATNFCPICLSYKNALTSKFRRKLRTSILAVPTEVILPSTTNVLACKNPPW